MPTAAGQRTARDELLEHFGAVIRTNCRLDRTLVSDQANRDVCFFGWLPYREAFSAALAQDVIEQYSRPRDVVLDPFAGVGTAIFVARSKGRQPIGIELLPVGAFAMEARLSAESVDAAAFRRAVEAVGGLDWSERFDPDHALGDIPITRGAYPAETERAIGAFRAYCETLGEVHARRLFHLACLSILESVSFTRKDGQYLRWDCRAARPGVRSRFRKGRIDEFNDAIARQLRRIGDDLAAHAGDAGSAPPLDLRRGSCLDILPTVPEASVDLVVTSPPYCNRYDYTRTYALELVYLGLGANDVKQLRQSMLSCTVENAGKIEHLRESYARLGRAADFQRIMDVFCGQSALQEVLDILDECGRRGALNNANIPRMVRNYFLEMCVVIGELSRVLRPGRHVVMVNDNVRYAGEEVPVDLILSGFAERLGLRTERIWTLARGKGNSSQQMGAHGRRELRKCVYVWRKRCRAPFSSAQQSTQQRFATEATCLKKAPGTFSLEDRQ